MQAHGDDGEARQRRQHIEMCADDLPEQRGGGAQRDKDGGKTGDEQDGGQSHIAPRGLHALVGELLQRGARDEGEIGRDQRQHAGAQEREHPGKGGGGKGDICGQKATSAVGTHGV